jgi:hypothetical protein
MSEQMDKVDAAVKSKAATLIDKIKAMPYGHWIVAAAVGAVAIEAVRFSCLFVKFC